MTRVIQLGLLISSALFAQAPIVDVTPVLTAFGTCRTANDPWDSTSVAPGEVLEAYAKGLGATDPAVPPGVIPKSPAALLAKVSVFVGGQPVEVSWAGLVTWTADLYQVNLRVPLGTPEGIQAVTLSVGGKTSNIAYLTVLKNRPADISGLSWFTGAVALESIATTDYCAASADVAIARDARNPPATLAGTGVRIKDSAGVERTAQIHSVSQVPEYIWGGARRRVSYVIPSGVAMGRATVTVNSGDTVSTGTLDIVPLRPIMFCGEEWECGFPAAQVVRLRNGIQTIEPVGELLGPSYGNYRTFPIDMGPETDQVFLELFGTGLRFRSSLENVRLWIYSYTGPYKGTRLNLPVEYAGPQGQIPGLDQVNVKLPRSLAGYGTVVIDVLVDGQESIYTWLTFK